MTLCWKSYRRGLVKLKRYICMVSITLVSINVLVVTLPFISLAVLPASTKHSLRRLDNLISKGSIFNIVQSVNFSEYMYRSIQNGTHNKQITLEDFWNGHRTGNDLIDEYGNNNLNVAGEMGRGVILTVADKKRQAEVMSEYNVNTIISDVIPLNRLVPDSRIKGCEQLSYDSQLPSASVIITFHNEWPSILLRTIYSVINRSPRQLLREIILVDDASTLESLQVPLNKYIEYNFPENLVRVLRMTIRQGLISARMRGSSEAKGDVLIFFDSHMEVNINWLPPLLSEISKDRKIVAMATLDYIQKGSFEYKYNVNYLNRYGWDWRLVFFETHFRKDQFGKETTSTRPGATMVGSAFAIEKTYFFEIGGYDEGMTGVWGGENLEMSWRVWLCGGRLVHVPCSRIGHIARSQPYVFPGGRTQMEHSNYKRAVSIWMGNLTRFIYHTYKDMKNLDVGDISSRLALKSNLSCKDFHWYMHNVWPELNIPDENMLLWGEVFNEGANVCLDNANYLFEVVERLYVSGCGSGISRQAFSLTKENLLRTSLQCVVVPKPGDGADVKLEDCIIGTRDKWDYVKGHSLVHLKSSLCLDISTQGPVLKTCQESSKTQKWLFRPYKFD